MLPLLCFNSRVRQQLVSLGEYLADFDRNSALYVSSRTLFVIAQRSGKQTIRRTLGRTNNGQTPLAAIFVSFLLGLLAFLAVKARNTAFQEVHVPDKRIAVDVLTCAKLIHVLGRVYTGSILCVYGTECIAFLRFKKGLA